MKNARITSKHLAGLAGYPVSLISAAAMAWLAVASPAVAQNDEKPASPAATPAPATPSAQPQPTAKGESKVKVSEHMTVDLHVKDEDLVNVLEMLSIQSQRNIVASKNVGGKISATLYGVTFFEALDSILHVNGYGYLERGNFIYVYTAEELALLQKSLSKRVAKTIRLSYLNAKDADEFVKPLLSKEGEIKTSKAAAAFSVPTDNPTGAEDYALAAILVVIDYEENIKAIEALVKELDTRPAQVLVEATILQTSLNESNAFGVDFSIIGDLNFTDFASSGGPLSVANALTRGGSGSTGVTPSDNIGRGATSSPGNTGGPSTFKVGIIASDFSIFLKMLDQVTNTTILSNPKILALNRQPSRVLVGRRVGYLSTTSTDTSTTQTVEFLDTGTQLYFRPFVSADNEIRMELKPQVSEAIIRDATDASGAAVSIPDEVTQGLTTNVLVRDGQTIVLGGLFRESTSYGRRQVPGLGDIPIIGAAFRGQDDESQRSEIIFMITPTIVNDTLINKSADRAAADTERLRAGARVGLLPWSQERMTSALNVEAERYAREGDFEKAAASIQRSLALNPMQPDALRLRDRITGQTEVWTNRSLLDHQFREEIAKRSESIQTPANPPKAQPWNDVNIPQQPAAPVPSGALLTPDQRFDLTNPTTTAMSRHTDSFADASLNTAIASEITTNTNTSGTFTAATTPNTFNTNYDQNPNRERRNVPFTPTYLAVSSTTPNTTEFSLAETLFAPSADGKVTSQLFGDERMTQQTVQRMLPMIREAINTFYALNGFYPSLGDSANRGWNDLVSTGLLRCAPVNFWSGGPKSDIVVSSENPTTQFNPNCGWIYNPSSGELFAVGFDQVSGTPLTRDTTTASNTTPTNTNLNGTTTPANAEHATVPIPNDPGR